jgi:hypothetical protein
VGSAGTHQPRVMNPLWIISLFLGLTEVTIGVVATQVEGFIQVILTVFAIVFPSGVAFAFFRILWTRPYVLYAPRDFPQHLTAEAYVRAMQSATVAKQAATEAAIGTAIELAVHNLLRDGLLSDLTATDVNAAVAEVRHEFKKSLITVDLEQFPGGVEAVSVPASDEMMVVDFLDAVWVNIANYAPPFTYGSSWTLQDRSTGKVFLEDYLRDPNKQEEAYYRDRRTVAQVGIRAGMSLLALNLGANPISK